MSARNPATKEAWITRKDIAILAAFLGFVVSAGVALIDLAGVLELAITDPSSVQVPISLALVLLILFAALGVVAAWQSKPVLAWVVASAFLLFWLVGLRGGLNNGSGPGSVVLLTFLIPALGPLLFILSAVLTTVVRKRNRIDEARSD